MWLYKSNLYNHINYNYYSLMMEVNNLINANTYCSFFFKYFFFFLLLNILYFNTYISFQHIHQILFNSILNQLCIISISY